MEPLTDYEHAALHYAGFAPGSWFLEYEFETLVEARKAVRDIEDFVPNVAAAVRRNEALIGTVRKADACFALMVAGRLADSAVTDIHRRICDRWGRFRAGRAAQASRLAVHGWGPG